jgi:hypothetical protein
VRRKHQVVEPRLPVRPDAYEFAVEDGRVLFEFVTEHRGQRSERLVRVPAPEAIEFRLEHPLGMVKRLAHADRGDWDAAGEERHG